MAMASFTISSSLKTIATGASSVPQPQETNSLTIRLAPTYNIYNEMEYHQGGNSLISVYLAILGHSPPGVSRDPQVEAAARLLEI